MIRLLTLFFHWIPLRVRRFLRDALLIFVLASVGGCLLLRWLPLPTSMMMVYRHWQDGFDFQAIDYRWASHEQIASNARLAVTAAEDQRFYAHSGFDFQQIQASIEDYQEGGSLRGASTISQQVAKNVFLLPLKSFVRKALEVWFTILIEVLWGKERILEVYLNIAEFGDHLFGVEAASQRYFGIPASQLSRAQAALLAATLPNPLRLHAAQPSRYVLKRQQWIMRQMRNLQ